MPKTSSKILVISDNEPLVTRFKALIKKGIFGQHAFHFAFSPKNAALEEKYRDNREFFPVNVKTEYEQIIRDYDLVISLHCKQLFPPVLVKGIRCVNVHPGLNPYNRGWFPQVFSIVNSLPCGATIHEIDEQLDHGGIIAQKQVNIESWDTSLSAYDKILDAEMELIEAHMLDVIEGNYEAKKPASEGNLNLKKDFDALCQINLSDIDTFQNHLDRLRALTHGNYLNAYFLDENGRQIFLKLELFPAETGL
jgi:methionyl-tRNA formyltransferase